MQSLHFQTVCTEDGVITLRDLPLHEGDSVEVVLIPGSAASPLQNRYPLRGEPIEYLDPFEPVAESDWEAK